MRSTATDKDVTRLNGLMINKSKRIRGLKEDLLKLSALDCWLWGGAEFEARGPVACSEGRA